MKRFATFRLGNQLFGLDVLLVREINQQVDTTPVQRSRDYIRGLINLRGQIVTIIDLAVRLGLEARQTDGSSHSIILKSEEELATIRAREKRDDLHGSADIMGLLVDMIGDVVEVEEGDMEPPPANLGGVDGRYLLGVAKMEGVLLVILNVEEVLKHSDVEG